MSWLLKHGASVEARTADGRTPLHLAADRNNDITVVGLLISHGADLEATDTRGKKPIDYAQENGKAKVVAFLRTR